MILKRKKPDEVNIPSHLRNDLAKLNNAQRTALQRKAKAANAPFSALKAIELKGLGAAVSSGRRPGVSPSAWAMARVNSVLTGGKARQVDALQWAKIREYRKKRRKK